MRARGVVRITPDDVGARVTVRYRIAHGAGEPSMTDVVGVLRSWAGGTLLVQRRDGTVVTVPESALVAARKVSRESSPRGD